MILIENQYLAIGKPAEEQYSHYQTREEEPQIMDENSEIKNINYSKSQYIDRQNIQSERPKKQRL